MVRNYKRKTQRKSWSIEQLNNAIAAIRSGAKIRATARNFDIPESTLRDNLKQQGNGDEATTQPAERRCLGRNPLFTIQQEQDIADHIVKLGNLFYGVTPRHLRRIAFDFAEANNVTHTFNKEKKLAGKDWVRCFLKRNPQLSLRQPEGTSINRISSFNAEAVGIFFENLQTVLRKHQFTEERIFNVDESGITTVQRKSGKIYAKKGQKQVGIAISAERGQTTTIICAVSAAGSYVPPMIIYPRKRMSPQLEKDGPIGSIYSCSDNGWSNETLFLRWLKHFQSHVKSTAAEPTLLILDNHGSHISLDIFEFCRSNHIILLTIPPHTSNHLQPLDLTFFGPLKKALYSVYDSHMISTAHEKITIYDLARLFNQAYIKVAAMDKGISGFRAAGIFPFNPDKFTAEDFAPADQFQEHILHVDSVEEEMNINLPAPQMSIPKAIAQPAPSISVAVLEPIPSTSTANLETSASCSLAKISDVAPIPKKTFKKSTNRQTAKKQQSEIWTSTPMKDTLLLKQAKRDEKNEKQKIINKRKLNTRGKGKQTKVDIKKKRVEKGESTSEEDSDSSVELSPSEDSNSDISEFAIAQRKDATNEMCIICGEFGKNRELWYRCVQCGGWAHSECSGWESANEYTCDECKENNPKKEAAKRHLFK